MLADDKEEVKRKEKDESKPKKLLKGGDEE